MYAVEIQQCITTPRASVEVAKIIILSATGIYFAHNMLLLLHNVHMDATNATFAMRHYTRTILPYYKQLVINMKPCGNASNPES